MGFRQKSHMGHNQLKVLAVCFSRLLQAGCSVTSEQLWQVKTCTKSKKPQYYGQLEYPHLIFSIEEIYKKKKKKNSDTFTLKRKHHITAGL